MKVIKSAKKVTYKNLDTEKYEFRACGGSIEPDERKPLEKTESTTDSSNKK